MQPPRRDQCDPPGAGGIGGRQGACGDRRGFLIVLPLGDDYIRSTIDAFREIDPDWLIPAHCTGDRFCDLARQAMPEKVIHSAVGTRFVFGE